jgi:6-pyruvoyltetrahydropterin/6-carboxytetrahydropterin synthase
VTAEVASDKLDRTGLVVDFRQLKTMLDGIVAGFDNAPLDELDCFNKDNPSAENVARYVYDKLGPMLPDGLNLGCVRVVEQPGCSAKFNGD